MDIPLKTKIELELVHRNKDGQIIEIIKLDNEGSKNGNCSKQGA